MVAITFQQVDGTTQTVEIDSGTSLMEGAVKNGIQGIEADCGGALSCATCHVHVEAVWRERLVPPSETERDMVGFAIAPDENSRLSCQITVGPGLEGMIVHLPASQR